MNASGCILNHRIPVGAMSSSGKKELQIGEKAILSYTTNVIMNIGEALLA
jgi:hypothetical protein